MACLDMMLSNKRITKALISICKPRKLFQPSGLVFCDSMKLSKRVHGYKYLDGSSIAELGRKFHTTGLHTRHR